MCRCTISLLLVLGLHTLDLMMRLSLIHLGISGIRRMTRGGLTVKVIQASGERTA